jgi:hypothetical protein
MFLPTGSGMVGTLSNTPVGGIALCLGGKRFLAWPQHGPWLSTRHSNGQSRLLLTLVAHATAWLSTGRIGYRTEETRFTGSIEKVTIGV